MHSMQKSGGKRYRLTMQVPFHDHARVVVRWRRTSWLRVDRYRQLRREGAPAERTRQVHAHMQK